MTTSSLFEFPNKFQEFTYKTMIRMPEEQEDPFISRKMQFGERKQKLKRRKIASLGTAKNIRKLIDEGDIFPFQECSDNMIFANLKLEEFSKPSVRNLLQTYQYALECLFYKQSALEDENSKLMEQYKDVRNSSFILEKNLRMNKQHISYNNKLKNELRNMLIQFKAIFSEFGKGNVNGEENGIVQKIIDKNEGGRYHCHICTGKGFSTEEKLESHMKRRHLNMKGVEGGDESSLEDSFVLYSKQIEDMKKHFEMLLKEQEQEQFMKTYLDNQIKGREATEKRINDLEKTMKDTLLDFRNIIIASMNKQSQQPIIRDDENDKRTHEELLKLTQSIGDMNRLICQQYDKKLDSLQNELAFLKGKSSNPPQEKVIYVDSHQHPQYQSKTIEHKEIIKEKEIEKVTIIDKSSDNLSFSSNKHEQEDIEQINTSSNRRLPQSTIFKKKAVKDPIEESSEHLAESIMIPKNDIQQSQNVIINEPNAQLLPNAPEIVNKTQKVPKKFFKRVQLQDKLLKTMNAKDELSVFFMNFTNRDNAIFDEEKPDPEHYCAKIIPEEVNQDENELETTLKKTINTVAVRDRIPYESFENKSKKELINIIDETIANMDRMNEESEMQKAYFENIQKAIDWKLYEAEKETMKNEENVVGSEIRRKGSKVIKASQVIEQVKSEFDDERE